MRKVIEHGTQARKILDHMRMGNSISGIEALHLFKVRDLPKRISELRQAGANIHGRFHTDTTGSRYMRYWLVSKP